MRGLTDRWLVLTVLVGGVGAACFAAAAVWKIERLSARDAFEKAAINRAAAVRAGFEHSVDILEAVGALYAASEVVTREQFRDFVALLLAGHHAVRALVWVPGVTAAERPVYVEQGRQHYPEFEFTERTADGEIGVAGLREQHLPIFFLEPLSGNEPALGFDLASHPQTQELMWRARDNCQITATSRTSLWRQPGESQMLLIFLPVYRQIPPGSSVAARCEGLRGFAAIVYVVADLIEDSLTVPQPVGIDIAVFDDSASAGERLLHFHPSRLRGDMPTSSMPPPSVDEKTFRHEMTFPFAGRFWSVVSTPAPGFFQPSTGRGPVITLVVGLLLTGLLTSSAWLLWQRKAEVERSNRALNAEIGERERVEESLQLFQSLMHHSAEAILVVDPPSARLLYVNEQAAQQLGYSIDELLALGFVDLLGGEAAEQPAEDWQHWISALRRSPVRVVERQLRRSDGEVFPVELSLSMVAAGGRQFVVAIAENISVRRRKEEAMNLIHERLLRLSNLDGLTGLSNRRVFDERLGMEWRRAVRDRTPLSLIIADIDHFKLFNDRYGHLRGDDCLKRVASSLAAVVWRPADLVARFGGEELAVLLPHTDADGVYEIAERMRTAVEAQAIPHDSSPVGSVVTISLGVGTVVPARDGQVEEFVQAVDQALYRSKGLGRNRTERAA